MNNIKKITASLITLILFSLLTITTSYSQTQTKRTASPTCLTMKEGKMMCMINGKMKPMNKDYTFKNGTKCMQNGEFYFKNGKKMKMREGQCIDMAGKMCSVNQQGKSDCNCCTIEKGGKYYCPMHKEIKSNKPGKCPKCNMSLKK